MYRSIWFFTAMMGLLACSTSRKATYAPEWVYQQIEESVNTLAADNMMGRETGTEGEIKAARYIMGEFVEVGVQAFPSLGGYLQPFTFTANPHFNPEDGHPVGASIGHNIVGFLDNDEEDWIVIGAHYDHLGMGGPYSLAPDLHAVHNGADDNASGVAAMLAIARQLKGRDLDFNVLLIAFSGEEFGLWGSKHFVSELPVAKASILYMLNFDMVGRMSQDKEVVIHGTGTSPVWNEILDQCNEGFGLTLVKKESGSGPSDHASFYGNDIPVLFFFTGQHEDYHKPSDDVDKINFKGIQAISAYAVEVIEKTENAGKITFTKTKEEAKQNMNFKVTLGVTPDYVFQGKGMRIDGVRDDRPAQKAGLQKGDVIVQIGEYPVSDIYEYMKVLGKYNEGDVTTITIQRDGNTLTKELQW